MVPLHNQHHGSSPAAVEPWFSSWVLILFFFGLILSFVPRVLILQSSFKSVNSQSLWPRPSAQSSTSTLWHTHPLLLVSLEPCFATMFSPFVPCSTWLFILLPYLLRIALSRVLPHTDSCITSSLGQGNFRTSVFSSIPRLHWVLEDCWGTDNSFQWWFPSLFSLLKPLHPSHPLKLSISHSGQHW